MATPAAGQARAKVVFTPSGRRGDFPVDTLVLEAARQLGVDLDSVCGGRGLCGRCQVVCAEGEFPKHAIISRQSHLSGFNPTEQRHSERIKRLAAGRRLGCQARILDDVAIDVPAESQVHRQIVRKDADERVITLDPSIHLYYVEVPPADMAEAQGDLQRLQGALADEWGLAGLGCDLDVLRSLQQVLRTGKWRVTVAVYRGSRVIAAWPGYRDGALGIALDVGSTTISAHLCDLRSGKVLGAGGIMNPQIRYGEDLMSRVSYVMMNPESATELTEVVRAGINGLIAEVALESGAGPEDVLEVSIVANPIMHHLLLGISPVELGGAPFALASGAALNVQARELGLNIHPGGMAYVLPCIAGHVGADCAGMILAEAPQSSDEITLLVDVGTNAEIVLGNRERLHACSSPTGPAFEGAQISCGQRAAPGAIERVRIDPVTLEPRVKVIGSDLWSDEPGFDRTVTACPVSGICGSGIIEAMAQMFLTGIVRADGVIDGRLNAKSPRIVATERTWAYVLYRADNRIVSVTQNDVRQIQLAKAALYAGIRLLMDKRGIGQVHRIRLAGAFGSHIDVLQAMLLGLLPDCPLENVSSAGNAAGTGARIALLNVAAREQIETLVRRVEKIETAVEPRFQEYFVDAMAIPHKHDPFTHLFARVAAPPVDPATEPVGRSRRGRRRRGAASE